MGKSKEKPLKYYYGIPHCHSSFSTGEGTPYNAFDYGKNNGLDFLIITDHNSYLSKELLINNKKISRWMTTEIMRDKFKKNSNNFLPLIGFETKTYSYGDFNVINPSTFFTGIVRDLNLLVLWMLNNPDSIITINHPHKNINFLDYNELLNKLITSVEVGNGSYPNKYVRYDNYYYNLLDKGWKLGAINGQDNHKVNFGDSENLTVFLATDLDSKNLIDAFRNRKTYSTESRFLKMHFTINGVFMGDVLKEKTNTLQFMIFAEDTKVKITSIEIITNKGVIVKKIDNLNLNSIKYMYNHKREENESWYLIKIYQEGKKISISSAIFLK
ncbi:MAG TPA: CehA/McbA family metallohydrolase [Clostridium sp.]